MLDNFLTEICPWVYSLVGFVLELMCMALIGSVLFVSYGIKPLWKHTLAKIVVFFAALVLFCWQKSMLHEARCRYVMKDTALYEIYEQVRVLDDKYKGLLLEAKEHRQGEGG